MEFKVQISQENWKKVTFLLGNIKEVYSLLNLSLYGYLKVCNEYCIG
jgi:hypothetical protein